MAFKYLRQILGILTEEEAITTSAGGADDGKLIALDAAGKLDASMMPVGFGDDVMTIEASETLAAGDFVNIHDATGLKCRKSDASSAGKEADGFVLAGVTSGQNASVYSLGSQNTSQSGMSVGVTQFMSATPGAVTSTAPSATGNVVQRLGRATSATAMTTESYDPITLA